MSKQLVAALLSAKEECAAGKNIDAFYESKRMTDELILEREKQLNIRFPEGIKTYLKTIGPGKSTHHDKRQFINWQSPKSVTEVQRIHADLKKCLVMIIAEYSVWKQEWDFIRDEYEEEQKIAAELEKAKIAAEPKEKEEEVKKEGEEEENKEEEEEQQEEQEGEEEEEEEVVKERVHIRELPESDRKILAQKVWEKSAVLIPVTSRHFCVSMNSDEALWYHRMDLVVQLRHRFPNNVCRIIVELLNYKKPNEGIFSMAVSGSGKCPYDVQDVISYADNMANFIKVRSDLMQLKESSSTATHCQMMKIPIWGAFFIKI